MTPRDAWFRWDTGSSRPHEKYVLAFVELLASQQATIKREPTMVSKERKFDLAVHARDFGNLIPVALFPRIQAHPLLVEFESSALRLPRLLRMVAAYINLCEQHLHETPDTPTPVLIVYVPRVTAAVRTTFPQPTSPGLYEIALGIIQIFVLDTQALPQPRCAR